MMTLFGMIDFRASAYPGGLLPHTDNATDNNTNTNSWISYGTGNYLQWKLPRVAHITRFQWSITGRGIPRVELIDSNGTVLYQLHNVFNGNVNLDIKNVMYVRVTNYSPYDGIGVIEIDVFGNLSLPVPENLKAIPDTRAAELTWSYTGEPGLDHFDIYVDGEKKYEVGPEKRSFRMNELEPDKTLTIYMTAVYQSGEESEASNTVTVTTYGNPLMVTSKFQPIVFEDRIVLTWTPTLNAVNYQVIYNGGSLYLGQQREFEHLGLQNDSNYTYTLYVIDKYGRKTLADEITVKTREPPEPEKPVVQIVSLDSDRIVAMWQLGLNPPIWIMLNGEMIRDDLKSNQIILNDLAPETNYTIVVGYVDKWGRQIESDPKTVTTLPPPDPVPITLNVQTVTENSVRLNWNKIYDVVEVMRDGEKIAESTSVFYVDSDLTPETQYRYQLRAVDRYGREIVSNEVTVSTNAEKGPPPLGQLFVKLQIAYHNSARINWNDDFQSYMVFLDGQQVGSTTSSYYHFNDLSPSTQYAVKVVAVDKYGREVESNLLTFTTTAEKGQVFPSPPGGGTPPPVSDSGNPDLDKPNDHLVEAGNSLRKNAVILIGIIITILIVMFGTLWLMGVFKKKMTLTRSAKGKENNVLRMRVTTNHNQVQRMFQRTNSDPMKQIRRQSYRRRIKR
jgi:hypothetical protein